MDHKLLADNEERTYALILDTGEDAVKTITRFAKEKNLGASRLQAVGALSEVTLGYYDWEQRSYREIPMLQQVEVMALNGDITLDRGDPLLHAHIVVGDAEGRAWGGHLMRGIVRPTLEVILTESPRHLVRKFNRELGLPLIDTSVSDPSSLTDPRAPH